MENFNIETIENIINSFQTSLSAIILIPVLLGTGIYLTVGLKFFSFTHIPLAFKKLFAGRKIKKGEKGEISPFGALMTALSATVGTGNIGGVALALFLGGPGALFWMWMTALVGMASKFGEAVLAVKYREVHKDGHTVGGPMYYIVNGMGKKWKFMAILFSVFGIFSGFMTGNSIQSLSISSVLNDSFSIDPIITGVVISVLGGAVILGGVKRIADVASFLIPFMALAYFGSALLIILLNFTAVPAAFALIFKSAFTYEAGTGGFFGSAFWLAMRYGVARGIFSNEAGQGSAPIAHAAATTNSPVEQGTIAMLGTFIDTLVICTLTGLVIIISGVLPNVTGELAGAPTTSLAFASLLPWGKDIIFLSLGEWVVVVGLVLFAFTTFLGWSYYSERCYEYLFGESTIKFFRIVYVLVFFLGAASVKLQDGGVKNIIELVWLLGDVALALMAFPNLTALVVLSPVIFKMTNDYLKNNS